MKFMNKLGIALLVALLPAGSALAQIEIKLGHVGEPGSLFQKSADEFAKRANEKLGGQGEGRGIRLEPARRRQGAHAEAEARHRRAGAFPRP